MCVCVCEIVCVRWQANKSLLILQDTSVTMLKSFQVLKHTDVCLPGSLLTFPLVEVSYDHPAINTTIRRQPYAHKHISALVKAPDGHKSSFMSRTWWKRFPGHWGVFLPSGRLLVYFFTHQHLYVPSLSFCSDTDQIQAIDHSQCIWIIQICPKAGAQLDESFSILKFDAHTF